MCIFENKNEKFVFEKIGLTQKVFKVHFWKVYQIEDKLIVHLMS